MQAINVAKQPKKTLNDAKKSLYSCDQCSYTSERKGNLKTHMLVHSNEKPFACEQCDLSYTTSLALKTHMLKHSGERPFICTQCDTSFTTAGKLNRHTRTHAEERHRRNPEASERAAQTLLRHRQCGLETWRH